MLKTINIDNTEINLSLENNILSILNAKESEIEVSDGYHTFTDLYNHRIGLFLLVISLLKKSNEEIKIWYTDSEEVNWYIVGIDFENGKKTISYHIPNSAKEYLDKMNVEYLDKLPPFDGCDSNCNLKRIYEMILK